MRHGTKQKKSNEEKVKPKTEMLRRNGPAGLIKFLESALRPEGSLWRDRFVEEVGLEPEVKERGSYARRKW